MDEVAPFAGVWIEIEEYLINENGVYIVAPFAGVWIEIARANDRCNRLKKSHPSRVCGLKC